MNPLRPASFQRLYKPGNMSFTRSRAHGGAAEIAFCRFASRGQGSLFDHLDYVRVPPGADIGFHIHGKDEEVYIVLDGRAKMNLDGAEISVEKGDVIINPPGGGHGLVNDSDNVMTLLVIQCSGPKPFSEPTGSGE